MQLLDIDINELPRGHYATEMQTVTNNLIKSNGFTFLEESAYIVDKNEKPLVAYFSHRSTTEGKISHKIKVSCRT